MAENARPQTSVPLPAGLIAGLGDASAAIKMARKEIKELQREITTAVRKGEQVSPDLTRRLDQAQKLETSLVAGIKRQKEVQQGIQRTTADAQALKFLIGAQAFKQILAGGLPDARALSAMVFASGEHIQKLAGRAFGDKSRITSAAKGFVRIAPFVGEAVASIMEAIDQIRADQLRTREFAAEVAQGKYGMQEWRLYQILREENQRVFGNDPKAEFDTIYGLARQLASADSKAWDKAIRPSIEREMQKNDSAFFKALFTSDQLQDRWALKKLRDGNFADIFQDAIEKQRKEMGFTQAGLPLSEEQERIVKSRALFGLIHNMTTKQREQLLAEIQLEMKNMGKAFDNKFKNLAQIQREASDKFKETEIKKMQQINFQIARRRVALNGRIGE